MTAFEGNSYAGRQAAALAGDTMKTALDEEFERGQMYERLRCAKIVCPDCAKGVPRDGHNGDHVLEMIEGHAYHVRACLARRAVASI